jgi:Mrp family chromosome partitioning ATPase
MMNPLTSFPDFADDPLPEGLQPSRVQFIRRLFPELSHVDRRAGIARKTGFAGFTTACFSKGWQISAVRAELVRAQRSTRVLAVTSGKGGVGKTTVVVNLGGGFRAARAARAAFRWRSRNGEHACFCRA